MSGIVPPYLIRRARIASIFAHYMAPAIDDQNSPLLAVLEALRVEVLDALELETPGGDTDAETVNRG